MEPRTYGSALEDTPSVVVAERATVIASSGVSDSLKGPVERVTYGNATREIGAINHEALGRRVDKQYERNLASTKGRIAAYGVTTATVVNFLPIRLVSDACLDPLKYPTFKLEGPKDGQQYTTAHFDECFFEPTRVGIDSPLIPIDQHPIVLAKSLSDANDKGVMSFLGIPADIEDPAWRARKSTEQQHGGRTYGQVFEQTRVDAIEWMMRHLEAGDDLDRLDKPTTHPQKASARRLHWLGIIKELPKWVQKTVDLKQQVPICPNCQSRSSFGASTCTTPNCGYIINPRKAYEIGAIPESDPSLERLTRAVVTEMGISDYVAETIEEKKERLKTGGMKPKSVAVMRMMETDDEMADARNQQTAKAIAEAVGGRTKGKPEKE
jgi:hypothetical protein